MAKGFMAVNTAREDINQRQSAGGGGGKRYFRLDDGESALVRFLEQGEEVNCSWIHTLDVPGRKVPLKIPCRDQDEEGRRNLGIDCPGCEKGLDVKFRGVINLIQRDAPAYQKDSEGNFVKDSNNRWIQSGNEDAVVVWDQGITVFEELNEKDTLYGGLRSRDFRVKRKGTGFNTTYSIEPADPDGGKQPLSKNDEKLAEDKFDLTDLVTPQSYESWGVSFTEPKRLERPISDSPFLRRRNED